MVNVSQNGHNGRAGYLVGRVILPCQPGVNGEFFVGFRLRRCTEPELRGYDGSHVEVDGLVDVGHDPVAYQLLDDVDRVGFNLVCKLFDSQVLRQLKVLWNCILPLGNRHSLVGRIVGRASSAPSSCSISLLHNDPFSP